MQKLAGTNRILKIIRVILRFLPEMKLQHASIGFAASIFSVIPLVLAELFLFSPFFLSIQDDNTSNAVPITHKV